MYAPPACGNERKSAGLKASAALPGSRRPVLSIDNPGFAYDPAANISPRRRDVNMIADAFALLSTSFRLPILH
jgi:hypothetical protein